MATWSSNKTTITTNGIMMLNAVQSGLGSITITRAVVGNTFSDPISLKSLSLIPSPFGNPILLDKTYVDGGSIVRVSIDNTGLVTPTPVCQVGLYATHPDINSGNEVLYLISQCDTPADTLPPESTTFVRLRFKMYVQHNQSDDFIFNLDVVSLPIASATELGGIKVGAGLAIDENGVLSGANQYELPNASDTILGGVKVGSGLSINESGVLSAIGSVSFRTIT